MRTLRSDLLRLQALLSSGVISEEEYKQVERERRGGILRQSGKLLKHGLASPVYSEKRGVVSKVRSLTGSQPELGVTLVNRLSLRGNTLKELRRAPEVVGRDALIRLDRQLVKDGFKSMLVKVVKAEGPRPVTVLAEAMQDAGVVDVTGFVARFKAAVSTE